jgi:hypothetical protein
MSYAANIGPARERAGYPGKGRLRGLQAPGVDECVTHVINTITKGANASCADCALLKMRAYSIPAIALNV